MQVCFFTGTLVRYFLSETDTRYCQPSPAKALDTIQERAGAIHLLITDVVLPGMNGRILSQKVTQIRPDIKVLFVSGYSEDIITHHGELQSGTNFLPKPYTHETLSRKVREVLDSPELIK